MKKLINHVDDVLAESLDGFAAAHGDIVSLGHERLFVQRRAVRSGKVALISGGGSGHEPLHAGFVGHGMLDAACPGHVFTSPTPNQMVAAAESVETGAGVLFIVKNYSGDLMNFQMAADLLDRDNATVIVKKMVGAAAERGDKLAALKTLGETVNRATASMGVALTACTVPAAGRPTFQLGEDEMEMGVGIHGEPGRRRVKLTGADDIAAELTGAILKELAPGRGQEVILLVNGFGGTPVLELYLMVHAARKVLADSGVIAVRYLTGSYVTSLDMTGCSITLTAVDPGMLALWDAPVHTPALRWGI